MSKRIFIGLGLLAVLSGCGGNSPTSPSLDNVEPTSKSTPVGVLQTRRFESCQDFKRYYADSLAQEIFSGYAYNRNCFGCDQIALENASFAADGSVTAAPSTDNPNREITETNSQELGVDEADLIETNPNSTEIYVLRRQHNELLVIDTADLNNLQILARIALPQERQARGMYLDTVNQRLAVILTAIYPIYYLHGAPAVTDAALASQAGASKSSVPAWGDFEQGTQVQFYDVSTPSNPQLIETLDADGQYVNSRRIGDRLHVITQFGFAYPTELYQDQTFAQLAYQDYPQALANNDAAAISELQHSITQHIQAAVNALAVSDLLPSLGTQASGQNQLACSDILRPDVDTRMGLLLINSIDTDGSALTSLGTINNAWQIYASAQSLYLLQDSGGWWFDQAQKQQTAIYRFDIASGSPLPGAVGLVDGWIGNSYQLGEFENHLRISSTEGRFRGPSQRFALANHLSVLNIQTMNTVGEIRDFVPVEIDPERLESIRSTRFVGPRGYVVTFQQTDPLFAFDLSDANAPSLGGQLEVPGFSSYIHPLSDDYLLTIGRAGGADGTGVGRGYQIQLFDVSPAFDTDFSDNSPIRLASAEPMLSDNAYAYSIAEHDPLAFTYLDTRPDSSSDEQPPQGLLSIPAQISSADSQESLSGFIAYTIQVDATDSRIEEYARIDHKDVPDSGGDSCPPERIEQPPQGCASFAPVIYNEPLRSVIIREPASVGLDEKISLLTYSEVKLLATDASGAHAQALDELLLDP